MSFLHGYSGKILKFLSVYNSIEVDKIASNMKTTDAVINSLFTSEELDRNTLQRMLTAMTLTYSDYSWVATVLSEIKFDRDTRVLQIMEMQLKIKENERKIKDECEAKEKRESEIKRESNERKRVYVEDGIKATEEHRIKQESNNTSKKRKVTKKRVEAGDNESKDDSKGKDNTSKKRKIVKQKDRSKQVQV